MGIVAIDTTGIVIGAGLALMILIAVAAFFVHQQLLARAVRASAEPARALPTEEPQRARAEEDVIVLHDPLAAARRHAPMPRQRATAQL